MVKLDNGFYVHNLPEQDFGCKNVHITNENSNRLLRLKDVLEDMRVEHKYVCDKDGKDRIELKYARWPYIKFYVFCANSKNTTSNEE